MSSMLSMSDMSGSDLLMVALFMFIVGFFVGMVFLPQVVSGLRNWRNGIEVRKRRLESERLWLLVRGGLREELRRLRDCDDVAVLKIYLGREEMDAFEWHCEGLMDRLGDLGAGKYVYDVRRGMRFSGVDVALDDRIVGVKAGGLGYSVEVCKRGLFGVPDPALD